VAGWADADAHAAVGYAASNLDSRIENYANVANIVFEAMVAYVEDVRAGRQIKGVATAEATPDLWHPNVFYSPDATALDSAL